MRRALFGAPEADAVATEAIWFGGCLAEIRNAREERAVKFGLGWTVERKSEGR
jgi:hypothetical protein